MALFVGHKNRQTMPKMASYDYSPLTKDRLNRW